MWMKVGALDLVWYSNRIRPIYFAIEKFGHMLAPIFGVLDRCVDLLKHLPLFRSF